ncbi:hypothetical protein [Streptomyces albogriseolus]|uniref:hypothetical protein n=1 Tax=Streptomyces albogriseolus TaxID=1887 RepID=UPI003D759148
MGQFVSPLVLLGGKGPLCGLATAAAALGLVTVLLAGVLLPLTRRTPVALPHPAPEGR